MKYKFTLFIASLMLCSCSENNEGTPSFGLGIEVERLESILNRIYETTSNGFPSDLPHARRIGCVLVERENECRPVKIREYVYGKEYKIKIDYIKNKNENQFRENMEMFFKDGLKELNKYKVNIEDTLKRSKDLNINVKMIELQITTADRELSSYYNRVNNSQLDYTISKIKVFSGGRYLENQYNGVRTYTTYYKGN